MQCQDHFLDEDFTDASKRRLLCNAVPSEREQVTINQPSYFEDPQATQSENRRQHATLEPQASTSQPSCSHIDQRQPLLNMTNTERITTHEKETEKGTLVRFKTKRENELYIKCNKYMRAICDMRNRLKNMKKKVLLNELCDNNAVKKLSKKLTPALACLLQGQIRNNNKLTGRRWSIEEKIIALRLFKRSPTCYRLLRRLFQLPSPGTLKSLLSKMPVAVGVYQPVLKVLKKIAKQQLPSDNEFTLMFDEMALRKHFDYNKKEDQIDGYQNHGLQGISPVVASHALVFMIAGIKKEVKLPIAHFFSSSFVTADRLAVLIKEVLHHCFEAGIKISATVCDMDGVNRQALSILGASSEHPYILMHNNEVVTLFDAPHLLKCFRNLFLKYDIECNTNISSDGKIGRGVAKWVHIQEFYNLDQGNKNFVYAPALTKDHLNPNQKQKMKVTLAAQVLSHTVAAGVYAKIFDGSLTADAAATASVVAKIDKLFDSLNSDSADLRRGKSYATNMTKKTPHLMLFQEMKFFFSSMKFVGCARKPLSQEGWLWTMNGVERLFKNLQQSHNVRSLATRRLQQDPLENMFGCIRRSCGSNTNPTTGQFIEGLKTAIISNLAHIGTTGHCETDKNVIINNFSTLLSVSQSKKVHVDDKST